MNMETKDKMTIPKIQAMKKVGEKITCLTAYDWLTASILDEAGIDLILVGDSCSMVFAGHETTLPISMDQMIYHTQAVTRGVQRALVISDMPFLSFQSSSEEAIKNGGRFLKEGQAHGVKVEGGEPIAETIHRLVQMGIPVMGHLGLTPQSVRIFGGYGIKGKGKKEADSLKKDARILEEAGVFSIVLEKIPSTLARQITETISVPTIGIGAGVHCDGQILVTPDMLGFFETFKPKFIRQYEQLSKRIQNAVAKYIKDVKNNEYPSKEESY
jgi:3-methyl-2-oxobutanoate hydroxymethyltransferase